MVVFNFFVLIAKILKCQVFLLLLKQLLTLKILPVTLFKDLVATFRKPPVTEKLAPEPGCDSKNCSVNCLWTFTYPMRGDHVEKTYQWQRRILMLLSVQVSEFVIVFKEVSQIFVFNIFFNWPTKKFKNLWHMYKESTDFKLNIFKNLYLDRKWQVGSVGSRGWQLEREQEKIEQWPDAELEN